MLRLLRAEYMRTVINERGRMSGFAEVVPTSAVKTAATTVVWRRIVRPVLFWTHVIAGVMTGGVVLVMSATGVLLTSRRSWAREQGRRIDSVPSSLIAPDTSVSERVARREHLAQILAAMSDLDTLDHTTIVGWLEASSGRELAMREGVAWATLRTRVHRALARLRDNLRRRTDLVFMPEPSTT